MQAHADTFSRSQPSRDWSLVTKRTPPKPVDVMLFLLPGIDASEAHAFRTWAKQEGLVECIRGDGSRSLLSKELSAPVRGGLKNNAHIYINGHGEVKGGNHYLCIDEENGFSQKSTSVMESVRRIPRATNSVDEALGNSLTLHMITCHSLSLLSEVTPNQVLWSRGQFVAYGSEEALYSIDALPCVSASLKYLGKSKKNPGTYHPIAMFEEMSRRRSDAIAIAGGTLSCALVAYAPRVLMDMFRPLIHVEITSDKFLLHTNNVSGSTKDLGRLAIIEAERITAIQASSNLEEEQIIRFLIKRIQNNDVASLSTTLQEHPHLINALDPDGNSLLIWAVDATTDVMAFLISQSIHIDTPAPDGSTPLHFAVEKNAIAMLDLLIAGNQHASKADLNRQDNEGDTPLLLALKKNHIDVALRLLECGADAHIVNKRGETPLMLAIKLNNTALIMKIVRARPDVYATDADGNTAIQLAVNNQNILLAEHLVKLGKILTAIAAERERLSNQTQPDANDH
jgi:ankyrin repeat protein